MMANDSLAHNDFVTVAEAAQELGVTVPRLRRLLARPDFARHVTERERRTRTGTRTSKGVPVTVLVSLREALERPEAQEASAEPERERENETVIVSVLVEELRARIADLSDALAHERDAHKRAEVLHLNTQGELSELRRKAVDLEAANTRLVSLLPSPRNVAQTEGANTDSAAPVTVPAPVGVSDDESGDEAGKGASDGDSVLTVGQRRGFWARLSGWMREN